MSQLINTIGETIKSAVLEGNSTFRFDTLKCLLMAIRQQNLTVTVSIQSQNGILIIGTVDTNNLLEVINVIAKTHHIIMNVI